MARTPKDTRIPAEKARDTRNIIASWMHEGYVLTPEAEAIHAQVARGEITSEEAIAIFRERALELDRKISQAKSK
jgi:Antitoxin VbhA